MREWESTKNNITKIKWTTFAVQNERTAKWKSREAKKTDTNTHKKKNEWCLMERANICNLCFRYVCLHWLNLKWMIEYVQIRKLPHFETVAKQQRQHHYHHQLLDVFRVDKEHIVVDCAIDGISSIARSLARVNAIEMIHRCRYIYALKEKE